MIFIVIIRSQSNGTFYSVSNYIQAKLKYSKFVCLAQVPQKSCCEALTLILIRWSCQSKWQRIAVLTIS